eukprot:CAMPEP_0205855418 /NCGR_PEP_ID=MMETSP1083-20121108/2594_1 /ASSEMBLY_ACC=CAM_ASM_000430 /TAXON_ID=97485 /ORGANISM="Prymnesium parvum, Strain Texoma1" /LENGTH=151 /DNA_ID=CAMNT_0053216791 /DNA_START=373 /DNA_END=830 /DNA_ORIENTATION=-
MMPRAPPLLEEYQREPECNPNQAEIVDLRGAADWHPAGEGAEELNERRRMSQLTQQLKERSDTTRFFDGTLCTVPQVPLQLGRPNIPPAAPLDARFKLGTRPPPTPSRRSSAKAAALPIAIATAGVMNEASCTAPCCLSCSRTEAIVDVMR